MFLTSVKSCDKLPSKTFKDKQYIIYSGMNYSLKVCHDTPFKASNGNPAGSGGISWESMPRCHNLTCASPPSPPQDPSCLSSDWWVAPRKRINKHVNIFNSIYSWTITMFLPTNPTKHRMNSPSFLMLSLSLSLPLRRHLLLESSNYESLS